MEIEKIRDEKDADVCDELLSKLIDFESTYDIKINKGYKPNCFFADKNVKEIYIIKIDLKTSRIPEIFLKAFNNQIFFQTVFKLCYNDEVKYFSSIKVFNEEKLKVLETYETAWKAENKFEFPITTKLAPVFKSAIEYITNQKFKQDETYEEYVERLSNIKKLNAEIERLTKLMNAEKQPNLKMALNDKIKEIRIELQKFQ